MMLYLSNAPLIIWNLIQLIIWFSDDFNCKKYYDNAEDILIVF